MFAKAFKGPGLRVKNYKRWLASLATALTLAILTLSSAPSPNLAEHHIENPSIASGNNGSPGGG